MRYHHLDLINCIIILFSLYLCFCFYDLKFVKPIEVDVQSITIEDNNSGLQRYTTKLKEIFVSPGDNVYVEYSANRIKTGTLTIDRIFKDHNDKEFVLSTTTKEISDELLGQTNTISTYRIPKIAELGCGGHIYSRSIFTTSYNILTEYFPQPVSGPKISVCVVKDAELRKYIFHNKP